MRYGSAALTASSNDRAKGVDRDAAVGDHNDGSFPRPFLAVSQGATEAPRELRWQSPRPPGRGTGASQVRQMGVRCVAGRSGWPASGELSR